MNQTERSRIGSGVNVIAGLWLMLSAFFLGIGGFSSNEFIVGIVVAALALIRLYSSESAAWLSWVNAILGIWLIVTPIFVTGMAMGAIWNSIILGIVVLIASWNAESSTLGHGHPRMG